MSKNISLILAIIFGGISWFLVPLSDDMEPMIFNLVKIGIGLGIFGAMFFLLRKFGYLSLALCLALIIIFAPAPYALPIDGIAKFMVALAVIAAVLGLEKRLNPNDEEDHESA